MGDITGSKTSSLSSWSAVDVRTPFVGHYGGVEPIALIGMSCRLPGGASDPQKLWEKLATGKSAWTPGPRKRFNMKAFHHPGKYQAGTTNTFGGHFLDEDIAAFDASFFRIHPVEASAIDPQQRLLMEIAYEAFENAGITPEELGESNTGVYVGQWTSDYQEMLVRDTEYPATYQTTGTGPAISSNRISYQFDLRGPSFTVDTGCSASLVALHLAVQSLRAGETDMSFVGGVNLIVDPQRYTYQSRLKMFSNEGRSFSFDHRANGYGRGEGCSGVILKPLCAALRDGNHIRAVIRNSVLNQDGHTPGISVPSGLAQEQAIRKAYEEAGLELYADYVEAHGTGTAVGDPIEVGAIAAALSNGRNQVDPLPIGSIKGNIGHTESAAGLTGLVKAVLMLEKGFIPPQVNFEKSNEKILLDAWNLRIPLQLEPRRVNRISVNSFGYGGTNAHVILDSADDHITQQPQPQRQHEHQHFLRAKDEHSKPARANRPRLFVISAASEKSCQRVANNLARYLVQNIDCPDPETLMDRLAYTLGRRSLQSHRVTLLASHLDEVFYKLTVLAQTPIPPSIAQKQPRIAFVFSGQGAQYYNMGRELINVSPPFARSLERANRQLAELGCPWDVLSELQRDDESRVDEPAYGQPLSTAIQLALVDTLASLGVCPSMVVGHSSGEIAAAYCTEALSHEDAMTVSYHRGRLTGDLLKRKQHQHGAMLAVGASPESVKEYVQSMGEDSNKVKIACYNSPSSVTVSGDSTVMDQLSEKLRKNEIFNRKLRTNGAAYHSDQMRQIEVEYYDSLRNIEARPTKGSVTMVSSLTGHEATDMVISRDYWVKNLVSPVLFADATNVMCQSATGPRKVDLIIEIGPHPQLGGPIKQTLKTLGGDGSEIAYTGTLKRNADAEEALFACLGFLFVKGKSINLDLANGGFRGRIPELLTDLPPYPFDHDKTFWHESRLSKDYRHRRFLPHELLGSFSADVNRLEPRWRRYLRLKESPWLKSHAVQGQVVFPAAGYITMALEAMRQHTKMQHPAIEIKNFVFRNISIGNALVLSDDVDDLEIALSLRPQPRTAKDSSSLWSEFRIFTVSAEQKWAEHCRGLIRAQLFSSAETIDGTETSDPDLYVEEEDKRTATSHSTHEVSPKKFYYLSREIGLNWQKPFQGLISIKTGSESCLSVVESPEMEESAIAGNDAPYVIHPTTLDACLFQGLCSILILEKGIKSTVVPTFIKSLIISARHNGQPVKQFSCYSTKGEGPQTFDITVGERATDREQLVLQAQGVTASSLPGDVHVNTPFREFCHTVDWVTYCESMTEKRLDAQCKQTITPGSVIEQNHSLDAVVLSHIQRALKEVSVAEIEPGYRRHWFEWMRAHSDDKYDATLLPENGSTVDLGILGQTIERLGPQLPGILKGTIDPLSLLTQDNLLSRLYSEERCPRCYSQIAAYCAEFGQQNPAMKVIEIGAGTASASLPILQAIHGEGRRLVSRYDFTDVSPGFFKAAKEHLSAYTNIVNFQVLDIEREIDIQGFEKGSYDLVVACNVIHATKQIDNVLEHARSLLRPGGRFILMEITKDQLYYSLVFGIFAGWWAGFEEGRKLSPLLTIPEWAEKLAKHGFEETKPCFEDYGESDGRTLSVFIARATELIAIPKDLPIDIVVESMEISELNGFTSGLSRRLGGQSVSTCDLNPSKGQGGLSILLPEICESLSGSIQRSSWQPLKDRILSSKAVLLMTCGGVWDGKRPNGGMMNGFARCFRLEHPEIRLITLDLDPDSFNFEKIAEILSILLRSSSFDLNKSANEVESEFAEREGQLYVARVFHNAEMSNYVYRASGLLEPEMAPFLGNNRTLTAYLGIPGLLETFRWKDDALARSLGPDEIRLELRAASINFKDVLIAAGQLEGITEMRNDCSGVVVEVGENMRRNFKRGDRVCAAYSRSYTNYPVVHGDCCCVVPDTISFEEAASLPIVWSTVYYSLVDRGRLQNGETVLIHSAAGAVGQAAIMLSRFLGAEVFVTVGSVAKRKYLMEKYGINEDHIFSSRTNAFRKGIKKMTGGKGVDVILNSLSGEMFRESCDTVAPFGRFVEIGRKDLMDDSLMPTEFLLKNITFTYVDLALIIEDNKPLAKRLLSDVVNVIRIGAVKPVTITTMPISDIETAFRQIQAGKHVGKVILTVEEEQQVKIVPQPPPLAHLKSDGLYIVVGGLGGLGRAVVTWMVERGARTIMTLSRSGARDEQALSFIDEMHSLGVAVIAQKCDISSEEDVKDLLSKCARDDGMPPVRGVIQSAMVLEDSIFEDMTYDQWMGATAPKVKGTWNLHIHTPVDLDFFIIMSSAVAISGNVGQSNYAAACSFQESLARFRTGKGLPAYSIDIGAVVEVGFVSENPEVAATLRRQGLGTVRVPELLSLLNYAVVNPLANRPSESQCSIGLSPGGDEAGLGQSIWMTDVKFRHLARHDFATKEFSGNSSDGLDAIRGASRPDEAAELICQTILQQLGKLIATPAENLSAAQNLGYYGVDSLVAVELRNWIGAYLQANVPLLVLRGTGSIKDLAKIVTKESRLVSFEEVEA